MKIYIEGGLMDTLFSLPSDTGRDGRASNIFEDMIDPYTVDDLYKLIVLKLKQQQAELNLDERMLDLFFPNVSSKTEAILFERTKQNTKHIAKVSREKAAKQAKRQAQRDASKGISRSPKVDDNSSSKVDEPSNTTNPAIVDLDISNLNASFVESYVEKAEDVMADFIGSGCIEIIDRVNNYFASQKDKNKRTNVKPDGEMYVGFIIKEVPKSELPKKLSSIWDEFVKEAPNYPRGEKDRAYKAKELRAPVKGNTQPRSSVSAEMKTEVDPGNPEVRQALKALNLSKDEIDDVIHYVNEGDTVEVQIASALQAYGKIRGF